MANTNQIDDLTALRDLLRSKQSKQSERLAEITRQLESVELTIALLRGEYGITIDEPISAAPVFSSREMRGMTQLEALIHMAKRNNMRIKIADAKAALIKAGLMKETKNSYNITFTTIKRSGRFQHVSPGEYELLPEEKSVVQMRRGA